MATDMRDFSYTNTYKYSLFSLLENLRSKIIISVVASCPIIPSTNTAELLKISSLVYYYTNELKYLHSQRKITTRRLLMVPATIRIIIYYNTGLSPLPL